MMVRCALITVLLVACSCILAASPDTLWSGVYRVELNDMSFLLDSTNTMTAKDIAERSPRIAWLPTIPEDFDTNQTVWLRWSLPAGDVDDPALYIVRTRIWTARRFEIYAGQAGAMWRISSLNIDSGHKYRLVARAIPLRPMRLSMPTTFFARIDGGSLKTISAVVTGERDAFDARSARLNLLLALQLGVFIVMIVYSFFTSISLRDPAQTVFAMFVAVMFGFRCIDTARTMGYLWGPGSWTAELIERNTMHSILVPSALALSGLYCIIYLQTRLRARTLHRFFVGALVCELFVLVVAFVAPKDTVQRVLDLNLYVIAFQMALSLVAAIVTLMRGYKPALIMIVAWLAPIIATLARVIDDMEEGERVLSDISVGYGLTVNMMVPAFVLLVILQSFAFAHRIRFMRGHAAELALHKEQLELEHAQEQARLIDAQRVELERSVVERTAELATRRQELEESNAELASTLEELRQSQRQLVQAEKLSTLGQLTFGIAHQLNDPINAVAVGVKPLRRDSEQILALLDRYAHITGNGVTDEELEELQRIESELELDVVLEEVKALLSGIEQSARRTGDVVRVLKTFSRAEEGGIKAADLHECLEVTLLLLRSSMPAAARVTLEQGAIPLVECRPGLINQAMLQILTVAVAEAGDNGHVSVRTSGAGTTVAVEVSVGGNSPVAAAGDPTRALDMAADIVRDHGGKLERNGTTVRLTLPVVAPTPVTDGGARW